MRFLHVANGGCTTSIIRAAGIPGLRSLWADPLYEGPVPGGLTDEELLEVRERFLGGPDEAFEAEHENSLRTWRANIERHERYDELVLWFEHDLFDQLGLIQVLTWIRGRVPPAKAVSLICIGSFPGRPAFKGLGELTPDELASLLDTRRPVGDEQFALAARAWTAFRAADPQELDRLWRSDLQPLPFLSAALRRFLEEYPWTRDGLSRSERRLLELADPGPTDLTAAFPRMQEGEDAYYITDGSILELVETLSRTSPALLTFDPEPVGSTAGPVLHGAMAITNAGRDVFAGRLDRIAACGLDRWYGGVHLQANGPMWLWDDQAERIRKA
jgi:hypothetical protein